MDNFSWIPTEKRKKIQQQKVVCFSFLNRGSLRIENK